MSSKAAPRPSVLGVDNAPITYFEGIGAIGSLNDVFTIGLTVARPVGFNDGKVPTIVTSVALLKANRQALKTLRRAIDDALLLGAPAQGEAN